jgi:hypothetical protein
VAEHGPAPAGPRVPGVPVGHVVRLGRNVRRRLGRGLQTLYLPEAHTDFVAAIIGEELGFVGVALLCGRTSRSSCAACARRCGRPTTTGRTSPSASRRCSACRRSEPRRRARDPSDQGADAAVRQLRGSSLLVNAAAAGILLNVSRQGLTSPTPTPDRPSALPNADRPGRPLEAAGSRRLVTVRRVVIAGGGTGGTSSRARRRRCLRRWARTSRWCSSERRAGSSRRRPRARLRLELLDVFPIKGAVGP